MAEKNSRKPVTLPAAVYYGWTRVGLPEEPAKLWATPTNKLLGALDDAIAQGLVPPATGARRDSLRRRIDAIKADQVKDGLKSLQRVTAISAVPEAVPVLMKAGVTSAAMISAEGESALSARLRGKLKPAQIKALYRAARAFHDTGKGRRGA